MSLQHFYKKKTPNKQENKFSISKEPYNGLQSSRNHLKMHCVHRFTAIIQWYFIDLWWYYGMYSFQCCAKNRKRNLYPMKVNSKDTIEISHCACLCIVVLYACASRLSCCNLPVMIQGETQQSLKFWASFIWLGRIPQFAFLSLMITCLTISYGDELPRANDSHLSYCQTVLWTAIYSMFPGHSSKLS